MPTHFEFTLPATGNSTLTIPLPEELRGKSLRVVLEKETGVSQRSTMRGFVEKYAGILKDYDIEGVEVMKEERQLSDHELLKRLVATRTTGIFSLVGILRNDDEAGLENDVRYNYLMEKYGRAKGIG